jgi:hypothetical protein
MKEKIAGIMSRGGRSRQRNLSSVTLVVGYDGPEFLLSLLHLRDAADALDKILK